MTTVSTMERFERIYARDPDPWNYRTSEYEREKYAETLAALGADRWGSCLEVGCSIGVFTGQLAERCEHVTAIDFSMRAIALARSNAGSIPNVEFRQLSFPGQVPGGPWDLVVCSEVLYYLEDDAFEAAISWLRNQLDHGTCLVAVSWTGTGADEPRHGDEVHDRLMREFPDLHAFWARRDSYRIDRYEGLYRCSR